MHYQEILPGEVLRPYVKCYYLFESDTATAFEDIVFPSGQTEIIFNLGEGIWKSAVKKEFQKTPLIEFWGQLTHPLPVKSEGRNQMFGIRFFAHSASYFFREELSQLNDQVSDAKDLIGKEVVFLHERLIEEKELTKRVNLIEEFLLERLMMLEKKSAKINMVGDIVKELQNEVLPENIKSIASKYNLSPRYLQKLFLQYTGVTPKLYHKINRFQLSLKLVTNRKHSLTSIAYDCGYFDQSHFIREFKSFTGITPSDYNSNSFPVSATLASS